jgi:hypothetical protein
VENDFHADVVCQEDLEGNGEWGVENRTTTAPATPRCSSGPRRSGARDYFEALKTGALKTVRYGPSEH